MTWKDRGTAAAIAGASMLLCAATAGWGAAHAGIPLSHLGVYFDGHLYLEIAKSFPLPFSSEGPDYLGQAPGYPAAIWLVRQFLPGAFANWGFSALLVAWSGAGGAAIAVWALAREVGLRPLWPTAFFLLAYPRWLSVASTAHPESLALAFSVASVLWYLRGRIGASMVWLALAGLVRYPALLLGVPLALGILFQRRERGLRTWLWLSLPPLAFAAVQVYLYLAVPGFAGILDAHSVFWEAGFSWPFAALLEFAPRARVLWSLPDFWWTAVFVLTYGSLLFYLSSLWVGFRRLPSHFFVLPGAVAVVVGFHVCLEGPPAAWDFSRLTLLAWPFALLIHARWWGTRQAKPLLALLGVGLAVASFWYATTAARGAVELQSRRHPFLEQTRERLDSDVPVWASFD